MSNEENINPVTGLVIAQTYLERTQAALEDDRPELADLVDEVRTDV